MTLSGKYQQYNFPALAAKANGISNFAEEEDSLKDDCIKFSEVYIYIYYYDLQMNHCYSFPVGSKYCPSTHPLKRFIRISFIFAKVIVIDKNLKSFIKIWTVFILCLSQHFKLCIHLGIFQ